MNAQRINTTVSYDAWQYVKQKNLKWSEVIKLGFSALMQPDENQQNIIQLQNEIRALHNKMLDLKKKGVPKRWFETEV